MFDDIKIKVNNSDEKNFKGGGGETDYSKLVFTEDVPTSAEFIGVKLAEKPEWNKPGVMKKVFRFMFRLLDDNGLPAILSKDCNPSITFGTKMRSDLYKCMKALWPTVDERELQDEGLVKARLEDHYVAEGKEISIGCLITIQKGKTGFIKVISVLAEPVARKSKTPEKVVFKNADGTDDDLMFG